MLLGQNIKTVKLVPLGDYTCFSLQAIKHITTGDGGVLVCKNEADYLEAKKLKWLGLDKETLVGKGNPWSNDISTLGYKGNMNDLSATLGIAQMKHVKDILKKFNDNGHLYSKLLTGVDGVKLVPRNDNDFSTHWTYVILVENRERIIKALEENGVASGEVHPRNDNYSIFAQFKRNLPGVDYFSSRGLCLPCGWWVERDDIVNIVNIIKNNI